jgi:hypothetical protein
MLKQRGRIHGDDCATSFDRRRHSVTEDLGHGTIDDHTGGIGESRKRNGINRRTEILEVLPRAIKVGGGNAYQTKPLNALVKMTPDQAANRSKSRNRDAQDGPCPRAGTSNQFQRRVCHEFLTSPVRRETPIAPFASRPARRSRTGPRPSRRLRSGQQRPKQHRIGQRRSPSEIQAQHCLQ